MNAQERAEIRHELERFAASYVPPRHIWSSPVAFASRHLFVSLLALLCVGAGSVSALAHYSLPGDVLYPIKVSVNDQVQTALAPNEDAQMDVELQQIGRSLSEEEQVADRELQQ